MKPGINISLILLLLWFATAVIGFSIPGQNCPADNTPLTVDISNKTANDETNCCVNEKIHFSLTTQIYFAPEKIHTPENPVVVLNHSLNAVSSGLNIFHTDLLAESHTRIIPFANILLLTGVYRL